jgi:hypothetical protein
MRPENEVPEGRSWQLHAMLYPWRRPLGTVHDSRSMSLDRNAAAKGSPWSPGSQVSDLIDRLHQLGAEGRVDAAVRLIFLSFDDLLAKQDIAGCERLLEGVQVEGLAARILLATLMATFGARSRLGEARLRFFTFVKGELLKQRSTERVDALLQGLL